jgi:hypothetical protein
MSNHQSIARVVQSGAARTSCPNEWVEGDCHPVNEEGCTAKRLVRLQKEPPLLGPRRRRRQPHLPRRPSRRKLRQRSPITLKQIAAALAEGHDLPETLAEAVVDDLVALTTRHLNAGGKIRLTGSRYLASPTGTDG